MTSKLKLCLAISTLICLFLMGCTSEPLKAPCGQTAAYCGTQTKINQW